MTLQDARPDVVDSLETSDVCSDGNDDDSDVRSDDNEDLDDANDEGSNFNDEEETRAFFLSLLPVPLLVDEKCALPAECPHVASVTPIETPIADLANYDEMCFSISRLATPSESTVSLSIPDKG
jgi:hypothetical protein